MAICLETDAAGVIHQRVDQSLSNCSMVALSGAEYMERDPVNNFVDGVTLGWGVVLCMAIAWGFRRMQSEVR